MLVQRRQLKAERRKKHKQCSSRDLSETVNDLIVHRLLLLTCDRMNEIKP